MEDMMRVISMQSPKVWQLLRRNGVYYADLELCREKANYEKDRERLNGRVPIWCWAYPELSFRTLYNGEILEHLRCEMSLGQENCWDLFLMLEIEVPDELLHIGIHHNACCYSKVFGELRLDMLKGVYKVTDSPVEGWYFKVITPIWVKDVNDCITPTVLDCYYWDQHENDAPVSIFQTTYTDKCLCCEKNTDKVIDGKHLCSLRCMFKHQSRFLSVCGIHGIDAKGALLKYKSLTDDELKIGSANYIKKFLLNK